VEEAYRAPVSAFEKLDWKMFARAYAHRSYPTGIVPSDTQLLLAFLAEYFPRISGANTLLDLASGPIASQICSAAPFTRSIIVSDISEDNLNILKSWKQNNIVDLDYKNWNRYTEFSLRCEGLLHPSRDDVQNREDEVRDKIKRFVAFDIRQPLANTFATPVDAISCFYGTEAAASCFAEWQKIVLNISQGLAPGGHLLLSLVAESDSYLVVDLNDHSHRVEIANISEDQLHAGLELAGFPANQRVVKRVNFSGFESEGYDTMFLVYAQKNWV
jgi:hypothetical protein